jgi:hypothetical protein
VGVEGRSRVAGRLGGRRSQGEGVGEAKTSSVGDQVAVDLGDYWMSKSGQEKPWSGGGRKTPSGGCGGGEKWR